jgi:hypothetical protein
MLYTKYSNIAKNKVIVEYEKTVFLLLPVPNVFKFPLSSTNHIGLLKNKNRHTIMYIIIKY